MKRWFLAAAFLLGSAGLASADYVIIVANVGSSKELRTLPGMGMAGMPGMGMAGMMGMRGGPAPGGNQGGGGAPPIMVPPGMANKGVGGGAAGAAGASGMPAGMSGAPGGMMGMRGGMMGMSGAPGGMMGMSGAPGGMRGMRGGMMGMSGAPGGMMGMSGSGSGGMMGMMGGMAGPTDVDDVPYFIIAVVEVKPTGKSDLVKQFAKAPLAQVHLTDRLGKGYEKGSLRLLAKPSFGDTIVLTQDKDKPLPTVHDQYEAKYSATFKDKPSADAIVRLAEWALSHGLIDKVPGILDKLVEVDKGHRAAVAYLKVKPELDRPATSDDAALAQIKKILGDYKEASSPHYTLVHNTRSNAAKDTQSHLEQLENSFRGLYYWFALKGVALQVPKQRQIVVLTSSNDDFKRSHSILTSGPVVVDGFFARRENTAVMASKRQDESYDALLKYYQVYEDKGLHRSEILLEKPKRPQVPEVKVYEAQMLALMLRALEKEAELATISHDASRQLLFASGLLPRNVAVPEWILFGMGSFFETPLQSPWPSMGAPSAYYLPRWTELKGKGFEKSPGQTLRKVITDAYFRSVPEEGKAGSAERQAHDAAVRRARTAAWSLTYFLATSNLRFTGLQRYFKELSKMPRDIELDDEVLLGCFARAFGMVDASNKVDNKKLDDLAREWYSHMDNVHFDSESIMKKIREVFREKLKEMQEAANENDGQGQTDPKNGKPPQPGQVPPIGGNGRFPPQVPGPGGIVPPGKVPGGGGQGERPQPNK